MSTSSDPSYVPSTEGDESSDEERPMRRRNRRFIIEDSEDESSVGESVEGSDGTRDTEDTDGSGEGESSEDIEDTDDETDETDEDESGEDIEDTDDETDGSGEDESDENESGEDIEGMEVIVLGGGRRRGGLLEALTSRLMGDGESPSSDSDSDGPKRKRPREEKFPFSRDEKAFLKALPPAEREQLEVLQRLVCVRGEATGEVSKVPMRFRVLQSDMSDDAKAIILARLSTLQRMQEGTGEYAKLANWLQAAARLPLGMYRPLALRREDGAERIRAFLQQTRVSLDQRIYGHGETKDQILRILAQWVSNPASRGHCIGIQGPMGTGKTSLVRNGLANALDLPFALVTLGGAADGSFLLGHSYTYEGSTYGKISESLMKTRCMNPLVLFDELDKISDTPRGAEVAHVLTHLTDASQNDHFTDNYFNDLDLDLSKALLVFSYNDESKICPILRDRMVTVRVSGYSTDDKLAIATNHLLPSVFEQYGLAPGQLAFSDDVLRVIIGRVPAESGVRNLRRGLEAIVSSINMDQYMATEPRAFPLEVDEALVRMYLKRTAGAGAMADDVARSMYM
jgi:hypothetical protein